MACALDDTVVNVDTRNQEIDSFQNELKLSNSIESEQRGQLNGEAWVVNGDYSYVSPEGEKVFVKYVADENGYSVEQANPPLPTPPPIPEAILKAIEYIKANAKPEYQN